MFREAWSAAGRSSGTAFWTKGGWPTRSSPLRNLAAALFRLEKSRDAATIDGVLASLLEWLKAPEQSSLRQAFAVWILRVLANRLPGVEIPKLADLQEVKSMLAENITEWTRQWKREGFEEGLERMRGALLREMEERFGAIPRAYAGKWLPSTPSRR